MMTAGERTQIRSPGVDWIRADIVSFVITYIVNFPAWDK